MPDKNPKLSNRKNVTTQLALNKAFAFWLYVLADCFLLAVAFFTNLRK
jgi:hypothetical protein